MGWVVAGGPLSSGASFPQTCFRDLEGTISCFDRSGLDLPESFQNSLWSIPVVSVEYNFAIAGRTVVDSLASSHSRVCSSKDPIPGPSQGRGSVLGVLQEIVGVASSSLPLGASGLHPGNGVGSLGFCLVCWVSPCLLLLSFLVWCRLLCSSCHLFLPSGSSFPSSLVLLLLVAFFSSSGHLWHSSCHLSVSLYFFYGTPVASLPLVVSVGPPIASLSHPFSAWLSSVVSSSSPVAFSCLFSSVASCPLPGVSSCSSSTVTSWGLAPVVTFASPLVAPLPTPVPSLVPPLSSVVSSSFPASPVSPLSYVNPVASSSLPPGFPRDSRSSLSVSAGVGPSSALCSTGPHISFGDYPGTSGGTCSFDVKYAL